MKKRYGVPAALLIALVAAGVAAAGTFYAIWSAEITVEKPKTETFSTTKTLQTGESWDPAAKQLDFYLPATYDLNVKLDEDGDGTDLLVKEKAILKIDLDDDGIYDEAATDVTGYDMDEPSKTLSDDPSKTKTFQDIPSGEHKIKVDVSATARDKTMATVGYTSGDDDRGASSSKTDLIVSMEPVYESG